MKHKVKPIKQEGGITLIALIITIIVLVILAAVTLNSIFGSNIIGLATNGAINYTEEQQKELGMLNDVSDMLGDITGDTDRPMSPTISLSGTEGENGYYISDVGVTINAGNATDVASIKYKVEGSNPIAETEATGTTANFDITADGRSTITAYIINNAGLTSEEITEVVNKDATNPSTATIAVSGEPEKTSIAVTANGADATSGVASYTFQYSTTNETGGFTTALEVQNTSNSCTFEYQDLASNTTYYLRVVVKDRAGHTFASTAVPATTKKAGMSDTELASNVGAYVDYTPVSGSFTSEGQYSGSFNESLSTITSLKWRIMFVDDTTITLISDTTANTEIYLAGANGYNNGVKLLDDACKAMYSNSSLSAVGRSLKIRDIEEVSTYNKNGYSNYGREYSPFYTYYPNIFADELTGSVNEIYGKDLDLSDQTEYVTGYSHATTLKGKWTYYSYNMTSSNVGATYYSMFVPENSTTYWLASRCVYLNSSAAAFSLFYVSGGSVSASSLYSSSNSSGSNSYAVRPVVEINLSKVNIGLTGDGGENTPYSIEAK